MEASATGMREWLIRMNFAGWADVPKLDEAAARAAILMGERIGLFLRKLFKG